MQKIFLNFDISRLKAKTFCKNLKKSITIRLNNISYLAYRRITVAWYQ